MLKPLCVEKILKLQTFQLMVRCELRRLLQLLSDTARIFWKMVGKQNVFILRVHSNNLHCYTLFCSSGVERLYALSFLWMREAATSISILVAIIVSFLTGKFPFTVFSPVVFNENFKSYGSQDWSQFSFLHRSNKSQNSWCQSIAPVDPKLLQ